MLDWLTHRQARWRPGGSHPGSESRHFQFDRWRRVGYGSLSPQPQVRSRHAAARKACHDADHAGRSCSSARGVHAQPAASAYNAVRRVDFALPLKRIALAALADACRALEGGTCADATPRCRPVLAHFVRRFRRDLVDKPILILRRCICVCSENLRAVPRGKWLQRRDEVGMDAQMVVNSPALTGGNSVRRYRTSMLRDKLISGLLYLRPHHDKSTAPASCSYHAPVTERIRLLREQRRIPRRMSVRYVPIPIATIS